MGHPKSAVPKAYQDQDFSRLRNDVQYLEVLKHGIIRNINYL